MRWMSLCLMMYKKHIICLRWTPTQSEMCQCKKAKSFFALIKLSAGDTNTQTNTTNINTPQTHLHWMTSKTYCQQPLISIA